MSDGSLQKLGEVLEAVEGLDPTSCLYLSFEAEWRLDSDCLVLPESDVDGVPSLAARHGLNYVTGMDAIQDAIANACQQLQVLSAQQRLEAFLYYYDNDAFMTLWPRDP